MFFKRDKENKKRSLPHWLPPWLDRPFRWLLKASLAASIVFLCVACFFWYQASKYDIEKVLKIPALNVVLDSSQNELAYLGANQRRLITSDEIPEHLKLALFAREDQDFESHNGVKITGLVRAAIRNAKDGEFTQGGSTLSMQLVKNTYNNREKTIYRKLLEIALTYRLESHFTKEEILTSYLNRIYFGAGCYGIEEASQTYFKKTTSELSEGESAVLVGIIRGPELFSPVKNPEGALEQRDQVIARMLATGSIDEAKAEQIKQQPIHFNSQRQQPSQISYALQMVKRHLNKVVSNEDQQLGNYSVYTSINPVIQHRVDSMHSLIPEEDKIDIQTSAVVINAKTGAILALNGGYNVSKSPFNIALDGRRTLWGAYTPLLYLAAAHYGENPIVDNPVQTGSLLDEKKVIYFSKKLQLGERMGKYEDLCRGDIVTSPLRLATAYSIFASGGSVPHSYILNKVVNPNGKVIYESPKKHDQLTNEKNIDLVREIFSKDKTKPWKYYAFAPGMQDAWCIYIEGQIVTVLWLGHSQSNKMQLSKNEVKAIFTKTLSH